jgi:hypothetical protein
MPLCHYVSKARRTWWHHCIILTPACVLVAIVKIKNKQFRGCPELLCWLGLLVFFVSIFLYVEPKRFLFLVGISPVQPLLKEAQKAHDEAVAKTYKLLRNLLSGDPQSQWDWVCCKLHEPDSWAGVNGQMITRGHLRLRTAFWYCIELHKLTVFTADMAKRQQFYIHQAVFNPKRATVQQLILQMRVLNVEWLCRTPPHVEGQSQGCTNDRGSTRKNAIFLNCSWDNTE